jgi:lantibiotic modifying enzyme
VGLSRFAEDVVTRVREAPVDLALLAHDAVPGSLFSGATGVAFFLLEAARLTNDDALLEPAGRWLEAAREWAARASPSDWESSRRGFLFGGTGLAYVEALLAAARGDPARALDAVARIERLTERFDDVRAGVRPSELLGGEAGVVCVARDLEARLGASEHEATRAVSRRVRERATAGVLKVYERGFDAGPRRLLGAAHGVGGELWALVLALGAEHAVARAGLEALAALGHRDEEGLLYWLPTNGELEFTMLATWCNGVAGHTLLWCECAAQTGRAEWLDLARRSAETTSFLGADNAGICCGLAGHALVLDRYADVSGDKRYTKRAYARLARAARLFDGSPDYRLQFWQGALGVALVAMKRARGERDFPCIEAARAVTT